MATRFYLPSSGAAAVSPAFSASWNYTNGADRAAMVRSRANTTPATLSRSVPSTSVAGWVLARQYVSEPLPAAIAISGTLMGQMRMAQSFDSDAVPQIVVRVVSNDGAAVRGTLYAGDTRTTATDELTTALRNQKNPPAALSPVALSPVGAQANDRIVVEVGFRVMAAIPSSYSFTLRVGDGDASDLSVGGAETTDLNPWVEFSADLSAAPGPTDFVGWVA